MSVNTILIFAGITQILVAGLFFRHAGRFFWQYAPVWRAGKHLQAPGVVLWVSGLVELGFGVFLRLAPTISS